jgi:hypothetical protein
MGRANQVKKDRPATREYVTELYSLDPLKLYNQKVLRQQHIPSQQKYRKECLEPRICINIYVKISAANTRLQILARQVRKKNLQANNMRVTEFVHYGNFAPCLFAHVKRTDFGPVQNFYRDLMVSECMLGSCTKWAPRTKERNRKEMGAIILNNLPFNANL